ncbi:hypothetical protein E2C01_062153 [Portunus trituberculatus]|uniref:Uncharacterized protein n=1 Tax=Portunus trituberculatus TaxID=210409 RepID=A0A5B7HH84_PORTR|nr:hypothetical protein [Portunus trituberculatus]
MGPRKELTKEEISAITSLNIGGKGSKEIASITGVALCSVGQKKCRDTGGIILSPSQKKRTWRPHVTSSRTLKILKHQVDNDPCISAKLLIEKNLSILQDISVHAIQKHLLDNLKFKY